MTEFTENHLKNKQDSTQSCEAGGKSCSTEKFGAKICTPCIISKLLIAGALIFLGIKWLMNYY